MRSPLGPGDAGVPLPIVGGATSGMTAIERARSGEAAALRVLVVGSGGALFDAAHTVGFSTVIVGDIDSAIAALSGTHHHAVLLDEIAGEVTASLARLHAAAPSVPVIVLARAGGPAAVAAGADDWIDPWSLSPTLLHRTVESAVARARARELRRRLEHSDRLAAIGKLAAGVVHEVNNPAAFVLMNLRTCRDYVAELRDVVDAGAGDGTPSAAAVLLDEMTEMLDDNVRGIERIVAIVHALRSYVRNEPDQIEPVDVVQVVRDACALVANQLRHRARLELELQAVALVAADARKLGQVVVNLLVNAGDAIADADAGRDHVIEVATEERGGDVVISISDTGTGIPQAIRTRIFEPFFTTKAREQGSGLGLAIARDLVERFGGRIEVDSEVGAGSRFEIILPIEHGASAVVEAAQAVEYQRARLLVVDDEIALAAAMQRQLRPHHDVVVANDGPTALALIERQSFDVILCDVMMPHMDGFAVYQAIARHDPSLARRVVFVSAGVFAERTRRAVACMGLPLLLKPVPLGRLLEVIDTVRRG